MLLNNPPDNILGSFSLHDATISNASLDGDLLTVRTAAWTDQVPAQEGDGPVIQTEHGLFRQIFTPLTLRFYGVRKLEVTMLPANPQTREVPVTELPEDLQEELKRTLGSLEAQTNALGLPVPQTATVTQYVDEPGPATLEEFLGEMGQEMGDIWFAENDGPEAFTIATHSPRGATLRVEYQHAQVELGT